MNKLICKSHLRSTLIVRGLGIIVISLFALQADFVFGATVRKSNPDQNYDGRSIEKLPGGTKIVFKADLFLSAYSKEMKLFKDRRNQSCKFLYPENDSDVIIKAGKKFVGSKEAPKVMRYNRPVYFNGDIIDYETMIFVYKTFWPLDNTKHYFTLLCTCTDSDSSSEAAINIKELKTYLSEENSIDLILPSPRVIGK